MSKLEEIRRAIKALNKEIKDPAEDRIQDILELLVAELERIDAKPQQIVQRIVRYSDNEGIQ